MEKLAELRKKKGLTQETMARKLDIGLSTYNQYENSQRGIPIRTAKKIALILNIPLEDIFLPIRFTVSKTKPMKRRKKS